MIQNLWFLRKKIPNANRTVLSGARAKSAFRTPDFGWLGGFVAPWPEPLFLQCPPFLKGVWTARKRTAILGLSVGSHLIERHDPDDGTVPLDLDSHTLSCR